MGLVCGKVWGLGWAKIGQVKVKWGLKWAWVLEQTTNRREDGSVRNKKLCGEEIY